MLTKLLGFRLAMVIHGSETRSVGGYPTTIQEAASALGCSTSCLHRLSRGTTVSVSQALQRVRAFKLVSAYSPDSNWGDLALRAGYRSSSALTNAFRRTWGLTPTACVGRPIDELLPAVALAFGVSVAGRPSVRSS